MAIERRKHRDLSWQEFKHQGPDLIPAHLMSRTVTIHHFSAASDQIYQQGNCGQETKNGNIM